MDQTGPVMLCATSVIKPGRVRVGRIAGNLVLPRTVPLVNLLIGGAGFLVGVTVGGAFLGLRGALYFGVLLGAAGIALVTYSPLRGESMLTWIGLSVSRMRSDQIMFEGEKVRVAVGICPVHKMPYPRVGIHLGAAMVAPSQYDERGVLRSVRNNNLDDVLGRRR
jgi:hypothetical protein